MRALRHLAYFADDRNALLPRAVSVAVCALSLCAAPVHADEVDLRLRITWGEKVAQRWTTRLELSDGRLSNVRQLGYEANSPALIRNEGRHVSLLQDVPIVFDGVDVTITASEQATLTIALTAGNQQGGGRVDVPIRRFLDDHNHSQAMPLGVGGNRLVVRRAPGDLLRVRFGRSSLVFSPGEPFGLEVQPHQLNLQPGSSPLCVAELRRARDDAVIWSAEHQFPVDEAGRTASWPVTVEVPKADGVYDLRLALRLKGNPLRGGATLAARKLQFVVIGDVPIASGQPTWQTVNRVEPRDPKWWQGIAKQWEQLTELTDSVTPAPLRIGRRPKEETPKPRNNGKSTSVQYLGQQLTELAVDGWEAVPLPISQVGVPHVLVLEYPNDRVQTLGISILDTNAVGDSYPLQVDSGIDVTAEPPPDTPALEQHRVIFWPRTSKVHLLLTNRRADRPAIYGKLQVLAGPDTLPAATIQPAEDGGRTLALYYDRPLFPENFMAREALDPVPHRSLKDWTTFYEGGQRLVQYLKHMGCNAAVISVARYGDTLYPTERLTTTTRYDNGALFMSGQDPVKKDVLEMLFRIFDREGLKLIPAVHFATPLPELEAARQRGESTGIELVGYDGTSWLRHDPPVGGAAAYYNPLDPRVQAAMRNVMDELTTRYSAHTSFGGLSLQLGHSTYAQLPAKDAGNDDVTTAAFEEATGIQLGDMPRDRNKFFRRINLLTREHGERWLNWRADVVTSFYASLQRDLTSQRPDARVYLATADNLRSPPVKREFRPSPRAKPDFAEAMLEQGLDARRIGELPGVVLLGPRNVRPVTALTAQAAEVSVRTSPVAEDYLSAQGIRNALLYHQPMTLRVPEFDGQSPFGAGTTYTWLASHISPSGDRNRARFVRSIATLDADLLVEGGWMSPLGQEESLRDLFATYRSLPAARFNDVQPRSPGSRTTGAVVRSVATGDGTYLYMVNNSPWPATIDLMLNVPPGCQIDAISPHPAPQLRPRQPWSVELRPYDLAAVRLNASNVEVFDWRVRYRENVRTDLERVVSDVKRRVNEMRNPKPIQAPANPGFEMADANGLPVSWEVGRLPGSSARIDHQNPHRGKNSLYFAVTGAGNTGSIRSQAFSPPNSGRLTAGAWIRTRDQNNQPPLRLIVEGTYRGGRPFFHDAPLGAGDGVTPLSDEWPDTGDLPPYLVHIDDFPWTELTEVRVRFELTGPGEVWIDDVQVFDLYFDENTELKELLRDLVATAHGIGEGRLAEAYDYLHSYWPQFVLELVPPPRVANVQPRPVSNVPPPQPAQPTPQPSPDRPNGFQRFLRRINPFD